MVEFRSDCLWTHNLCWIWSNYSWWRQKIPQKSNANPDWSCSRSSNCYALICTHSNCCQSFLMYYDEVIFPHLRKNRSLSFCFFHFFRICITLWILSIENFFWNFLRIFRNPLWPQSCCHIGSKWSLLSPIFIRFLIICLIL